MQEDQNNLRKAVAKNFFESYDQQLLESFQDSKSKAKPARVSKPSSVNPRLSRTESSQSVSFSDLEEAIADIDLYLQQAQEPSEALDSEDSTLQE
ncbi:MAG: hypothetical protein ACRC8A_14575 [Microcoleaceae cyanobacterium]